MKKLIFFLLLLLSTASLSAQSEQPSDSIRHLPSTVKQYGDFLIDMGLFIAAPPKLPKYKFVDGSAGNAEFTIEHVVDCSSEMILHI